MVQDGVQLTANTPFTAKVVVDVLNDGTDKETCDGRAGIQQTNLGSVGIPEILVPGREGLKTTDQRSVVWLSV